MAKIVYTTPGEGSEDRTYEPGGGQIKDNNLITKNAKNSNLPLLIVLAILMFG